MNDEKVYRNVNLTLDKLAEKVGINPRYLSTILNNVIGKNFYDFVNLYRIEEVKQLLQDSENRKLTIEAIANKCGFKTKSSFNTAFKKYVTLTPTQYLKSIDK